MLIHTNNTTLKVKLYRRVKIFKLRLSVIQIMSSTVDCTVLVDCSQTSRIKATNNSSSTYRYIIQVVDDSRHNQIID